MEAFDLFVADSVHIKLRSPQAAQLSIFKWKISCVYLNRSCERFRERKKRTRKKPCVWLDLNPLRYEFQRVLCLWATTTLVQEGKS